MTDQEKFEAFKRNAVAAMEAAHGAESRQKYGDAEVDALRRIKLMRKLGVPLEEIRQMLSGAHTVADGMRRHLVTLERERKNLEESMALCRRLKEREEPLSALDAQALLEEMSSMEHQGATFPNRQAGDARRVRYIAPWAVTVIMVAFMGGLIFACKLVTFKHENPC